MLVLIGLARNTASPAIVLFTGLGILMTAQGVTGTARLPNPAQAVAGFGNSGLITVGLLFVVVAGLVRTGAMTLITEPLLGRPRSLRSAQLRLLGPVTGLSAFLNNTPVVAMFLPVVSDLAKRSGLPPSRLFLPLSYASILGGMCTLIGTSTNLVVDGMLTAQTGQHNLGIFDLAWIGVPAAAVGLVYILTFSGRLLPGHGAPISMEDDPRRYTAEVIVQPGGPLVGMSVEEAGLRRLQGLFLAEIERNGEILPAVSPRERLHAEDRLVFVGVVESVVDLHRIRGLQPAADQLFKLKGPRSERCLVEAVVSPQCPLAGRSVREGRFRQMYNAVVVAVARGGQRLSGKIGDIVLQPGDTLLLETHPEFLNNHRNTRDFYLVSQVRDSTPPRHERAATALTVLAAMVIVSATGLLSMLNAALLAAGAILATGCCTGDEARRTIDWSVLVVIGTALGIGQALAQSGAAPALAHGLISLAGGHAWLVLLAVFVVTSLFTEVITNNAAAVLVFPVAYSASNGLGVDFMPFAICIMIAASASFSSPIGYQTNLMVYGPGGYRFADYLRFGIPLNLLVMVVTVGLAPLVWPF
jgi:di/tricarboxylate transporter